MSEDNTPKEMESPVSKKIRSQAPDVTVSVGSGESKQEFKCYKVVLSFASPYLDAMLSSSMKEGEMSRVDFPDKDPEEWKLFYNFISPGKIGTDNCAEISHDNVMVLLPWFHELQINYYVKKCDDYLAKSYFSGDMKPFWGKERQDRENNMAHNARIERRRSKFEAILGVLQLSHIYDLKSTKDAMEKKVSILMDMLPQTHDLFDLPTVKTLLQFVLPLELSNDAGVRMKEGESLHIWPAFEKILSPHISTLTQSIIDHEDHFPLLFHSYIQSRAEKEKAQAATSIINSIINHTPDRLYDMWPNYNDTGARDKLKETISSYYNGQHKGDFKTLGITLPW